MSVVVVVPARRTARTGLHRSQSRTKRAIQSRTEGVDVVPDRRREVAQPRLRSRTLCPRRRRGTSCPRWGWIAVVVDYDDLRFPRIRSVHRPPRIRASFPPPDDDDGGRRKRRRVLRRNVLHDVDRSPPGGRRVPPLARWCRRAAVVNVRENRRRTERTERRRSSTTCRRDVRYRTTEMTGVPR